MDNEVYRDYHIAAEANGHGWRVWAHPQFPELPITSHASFDVEADTAEQALAQAKEKIDSLLSLF